MEEPVRKTHVYSKRWRDTNVKNMWIGTAAFLSAWVIHALVPPLAELTTYVLSCLRVSTVDTKVLESYLSVYMGAPTALAFWVVYSRIVDEHLWRVGALRRWFSRTPIPDLAGTWWGTIHAEGYGGDFPAAISIQQTGTEICIAMFASDSRSTSSVAVFVKGEFHLELIYEYWNEPYDEYRGKVDKQGILRTPHGGTAHLELLGPDKFQGRYYTRPDDTEARKQHHGLMIDFERISRVAASDWKHAQALRQKA
ncbi:MAG: hypothetical protein ACHQZS_09575 [Candidatus Binatales bacterium]